MPLHQMLREVTVDRIGIGVIGCGDICRARYLPSIAASPGLKLAGAFSRTRASSAALVGQYGGKVFDDAEALLRDPEVEAVIVATPHPSHAEYSIKALEAGKHVLTEKPMATNLADAERICEAARHSRGVFMPLPLDSCPPVDEARRLIHSGSIGRVSSADAVLAHNGPSHAGWFFDASEAGWGVLADLGIYLVSQLTYLLGPAHSVLGRVATIVPTRTLPDGRMVQVTVEDNAAAVLTWSNKVLATLRANWCSPGDRRNFIWHMKICGSEGIIFIDMARPGRNLIVYSPGRPIDRATPIFHDGMTECYLLALPEWDIHKDVLARFLESIRSRSRGKKPDTLHAYHVIDTIDRIYKSSATGQAQLLGGTA
jgi:predicted dehydrogenase